MSCAALLWSRRRYNRGASEYFYWRLRRLHRARKQWLANIEGFPAADFALSSRASKHWAASVKRRRRPQPAATGQS